MRTWSTAEVSKLAGVSARTLRHYDAIGLLEPAEVGHGGLRHYGQDELLRLQQILLLRRLGLALGTIGDILDGGLDTTEALRRHADWLAEERRRLDRLASSVDATIRQLEGGQPMAPETWFEGLDAHRQSEYDAEARRRWGQAAVEQAYTIMREMTREERAAIPAEFDSLNRRLAALLAQGRGVGDGDVAAVIADHYRLMERLWGRLPTAEAYKELGTLYTDDPRFNETYEAVAAGLALYLRDAMHAWAEEHLTA
ncbi:MerR family transcriptional regulator [Glycomyces arizonensis]|uniref:MerR family transcriptional regulator n=1 Tax=Glycomyces arizonensis TaxID=256035 RepID=UPI00047EA3C8|nr:TipAS antibiotic-recognition domain-containing protein [Glycomyces arizonensis]